MARRLVQYVEITDDFDRNLPADETVEVALDGVVYEIDLSSARAKEVREFLAPYQEAAHERWKMPPRAKKKPKTVAAQMPEAPRNPYNATLNDRAARNNIREWARENGWEVANIGKIPVDAIQAFMEAHPDAYVPETTLIDAGLHV